MTKEFKEVSVVRWDVPSYARLETSELDKMPPRIQAMVVNHLLKELGIPITIDK